MADIGSLLGSAGIGGAIGKAIVTLELETKKYMAEMQAAQAQTTAGATKMSSGLASFGNIAGTAFVAAGAAAVAFGAYSVKAAIEANDAHLKLSNTFENNAMLADSSVASFERQADAIRSLTGVDDEAIVAGQALLGSFKLTGQQVQALTPLVVDLAAKYDIDLQTAFKAVGKATQGNTATLSRYGIQIDETDAKTDAFGATLKGLGVAQGFAADRAEAEPWRVLAAEFEEVAEQLGQVLLPIFTSVAGVLVDFTRVIMFLTGATKEFDQVVQDATIHVAQFELGVADFFLDLTGGIPIIGDLTDQWRAYTDAQEAVNDAIAENLAVSGPQTGLIGDLSSAVRGFAGNLLDAIGKAQRFGQMGKKAFAEFKEGLVESLQVSAGQFEKFNDAFDTTPKELQKQLSLALRIARQSQADLKEIFADKSLTDAQKQALAELPANQRHAWAEGGKAAKKQIEQDAVALARANTQGAKAAANAAEGAAKAGGQETGAALITGAILGINQHSPELAAAVRNAVRNAINAGKAEAGAESPSKVMRELGLDMMTGLYQGITSGAQKVLDAATREIEKLIEKIGSELDKVKSKAQSFADTIGSSISQFADVSGLFGGEQFGTDIGAILSAQLGKAQQLAAVLEALERQGASKATLAQVAQAGTTFGQTLLQGGPDLIVQMNASLATISRLANETGKGLSEHFFGEKIDRLEERLEKQNEILRDIREIERLGHGHAIVLDGQKLGEAVRKELIKIGNRNGDALGPNG